MNPVCLNTLGSMPAVLGQRSYMCSMHDLHHSKKACNTTSATCQKSFEAGRSINFVNNDTFVVPVRVQIWLN